MYRYLQFITLFFVVSCLVAFSNWINHDPKFMLMVWTSFILYLLGALPAYTANVYLAYPVNGLKAAKDSIILLFIYPIWIICQTVHDLKKI